MDVSAILEYDLNQNCVFPTFDKNDMWFHISVGKGKMMYKLKIDIQK